MADTPGGNQPTPTFRSQVILEDGGSVSRVLERVEALQKAVNTLQKSFKLNPQDLAGDQGLAKIRQLTGAVKAMQEEIRKSGQLSALGGLTPEKLARGQYSRGMVEGAAKVAQYEMDIYKAQVLQGKVKADDLRKEQDLNRILAARKVLSDQIAAGGGDRWTKSRLGAIDENLGRRKSDAEVNKAWEAALKEDILRTKRAENQLAKMHEQAIREDILRTKRAEEEKARIHEAALKEDIIRMKRQEKALEDMHERALRDNAKFDKRQAELARRNSLEYKEGQLNEQREHTRKRLFGDGGAHLMTVQAGLMANYAILSGFQNIVSGAISASVQFDQSLRQLQAITATTSTEMVGLSSALVDIAKDSRFSAVEVANAAVLLGQAGLSVAQIQGSMKAIITLAQASGSDLKDSVDVVTSVLGVFNKDASQTMTIANQMTQALNSSKLDMQKLSLGLQYAGNTAADSGVSFEELTAALGALANSGIKSGSTLGTGLRQILIDIQKPSQAFLDTLKRLGLTLNDVDFRTQGFEGVLTNLRSHGFTAADAFQSFEVRAASAFAALSNNTDVFRQMSDDLYGTEAALAANAVQMESLASQADKLVSNLGIVASKALQPMLILTRDLTKGLSKLVTGTEEWGTTLKVVGTTISAVLLGLMARGIGAMTVGMVGMAGGIGNVVVSTNLLTASMIRLTGALVAVRTGSLAAGLGGLAVGLGTLALATGPVLIALGILGAAFLSSSSEAEKLNDALDKQKAKLSQAKEGVTTQREAIDRLDAAVEQLHVRHGALNESQTLLQSTVRELTAQFEENGLVIDNVAGKSVEGLIQKLGELRQSMSADFLIKIREQYSAQRETLGLEAQQRLDQARVAGNELADLLPRPGSSLPRGVSEETLGLLRNIATYGMLGGTSTSYLPGGSIAKGRQALYAARPGVESNIDALALVDKALTVLQYAESRANKLEQQKHLVIQEQVDKAVEARKSQEMGAREGPGDFWAQLGRIKSEYSTKKQAHETNLIDFLRTNTEWMAKEIEESQAENSKLKDRTDAIALTRVRYNNWKIEKLSAEKSNLEKDMQQQQKELDKVDLAVLKARRERAQRALSAANALLNTASTQGDVTAATRQGRGALDELGFIKAELVRRKKQGGDQLPEIQSMLQEAEGFTQEAFGTVVKSAEDRIKKGLDNLRRDIASQEAQASQRDVERNVKNFLAFQKQSLESLTSMQKTDLEALQRQLDAANGEKSRYGVSDRVRKDLEKKIKDLKLTQEDALLAQLKTQVEQFDALIAPMSERRGDLEARSAEIKAKILKIQRAGERAGGLTPAQQSEIDTLSSQQQSTTSSIEALNSQISSLEQENNQLRQKLEDLGVLVRGRPSKDSPASRKQQVGAALGNLRLSAEDKEASLWYEATTAGVQQLTKSMADLMTQAQLTGHTTSEAFRQMGVSILQTMLSIINEQIAKQFISMIFGSGNEPGRSGPSGSIFEGAGSALMNIGRSIFSGSLFGSSSGGPVLRRSSGGEVPGNLARDSVPTLLMPGEFVLQKSAADALGGDYLNRLNAQTEATLRQNSSRSMRAAEEGAGANGGASIVNVWVVTPDQQTAAGKDDCIVKVSDNIARGGTLRKLIKQVIVGG